MQFPTKINREDIYKIKEFHTGIKEFFSREEMKITLFKYADMAWA